MSSVYFVTTYGLFIAEADELSDWALSFLVGFFFPLELMIASFFYLSFPFSLTYD